MKYADIPRHIPSYEYCEQHIQYEPNQVDILNHMGKDGWRKIDEYECMARFKANYSNCQVKRADGTTCVYTGEHKVALFEREVHEFRTKESY